MRGATLRGNDAILHDRCACGRQKEAVDYVCSRCYQLHQHTLVGFSPPFRLVAPPRYNIQLTQRLATGGGDLCRVCPMVKECSVCIQENTVLGCEWADESDTFSTPRIQ